MDDIFLYKRIKFYNFPPLHWRHNLKAKTAFGNVSIRPLLCQGFLSLGALLMSLGTQSNFSFMLVFVKLFLNRNNYFRSFLWAVTVMELTTTGKLSAPTFSKYRCVYGQVYGFSFQNVLF